ncbi:MAG: polysaccharide deacetylase family protein [Nitrospiraceae bacterium]
MFTTRLLLGAITVMAPAVADAQVIKSGPSICKNVALTFDLCPVRRRPGFDRELIELMVNNRIPATFFLSGKWISRHDAEANQLLRVPFFEVGTHGEVHTHLPLQSADEQRQEILGPVTMLKTKYEHQATLFRPPYGEYNDLTTEVVKTLGLQFILWNIESGDPDPLLSAEQIVERVTKRVKAGSVIVFHANGKGMHTRAVIEQLTTEVFPKKGLQPVTVSELLTCNQPTH